MTDIFLRGGVGSGLRGKFRQGWLYESASPAPKPTVDAEVLLRRLIGVLQASALPGTQPAPTQPRTPPPQFVTLADAATLARVSKKTAERWRKNARLPEPEILASKGKANKWLWDTLRPAIEKQIGHDLPEQFPSFFSQN